MQCDAELSTRMLRRLTTRLPLCPLKNPAFRPPQFLASPYCTHSKMPDSQDPAAVVRYLEQSHEKIFESNRAWVAAKKDSDPEFFTKLSAGQAPDYLYVCYPDMIERENVN
jgi:carbonic anhydrase